MVVHPTTRMAAASAAFLLLAGLAAAGQPAATTQPARSTQPAAESSPNFVVGANDRLRITVWNHDDISGEYTVDRDGTFTFPLIGRVTAGGLTLAQLETELRRLLMDGFYKNPQVTVAVVENRSTRVFAVGELRAPGTVPIPGDVTLIEVLAKAGSTTPDAADHVLIVHSPQAKGPVLPGQDPGAEVTRVDLKQLGNGQSDVTVHDGDTVFVPRASTIYVYGQVRRPGSVPITAGTTVRQALALAGGVSEFGAANRVKILRVVNGKEQEIKARLTDPVLPGDTLVVPERFF